MSQEVKTVFSAEDRVSRVAGVIRGELQGLESQLGAVGTVGLNLGRSLGPALGGVALGAGVAVAGIVAMVNALDDLDEAAQNANIAAVALADMRIAARESGVDLGQLDRAIAKLNIKLAEARGGSAEAQRAFRAMGFDWADASLNAEDAMHALAGSVAGFKDGAEKAAFVAAILGEKLGPKFIAYLNGGAEGLTRISGVTEESVKHGADLAKQIDILTASLDRLKNSAAGFALPFISERVEWLNEIDFKKVANEYNNGYLMAAPRAAQELVTQGALAKERIRQRDEALALMPKGGYADPNLAGAGGRSTAPNLDAIKRQSDEEEAARKKSAAAALTHASALASLGDETARLLATQQAEAEGSGKLNDADRLAIKISQDLAAGKFTLAELTKKGILQTLADAAAQAAANEEKKRAAEAQRALSKAYAESLGALEKETESIEARIARAHEENAAIGLTKVQLEQLEAARVNDEIATKRQTLAAL
ncbi:MAG: hypothetical protein RR101_14815, partial [Burkholderiaceae bacterium]